MVCPELLSKLGIDLPFSIYFQHFTRRERGKGSDHGHGLAVLERKFADGVACVRAVEYYSLYRAFKIIHFFWEAASAFQASQRQFYFIFAMTIFTLSPTLAFNFLEAEASRAAISTKFKLPIR